MAEQEGGQAEIARVKSLQRILEKGCSYKGAEFQFDLLNAKDNNRGKVWKLLLRLATRPRVVLPPSILRVFPSMSCIGLLNSLLCGLMMIYSLPFFSLFLYSFRLVVVCN